MINYTYRSVSKCKRRRHKYYIFTIIYRIKISITILKLTDFFSDLGRNIRSKEKGIYIHRRVKYDGASAKSDVPLITYCYSLTINIWAY